MADKRPYCVVTRGATEIANPLEATVTLGVEQENGACDLQFAASNSLAESDELQVYMSADGSGSTTMVFNGEVAGTGAQWPGPWTVEGRDIMARLRLPWGDTDRTYTSSDDAALIQNVVEAYGVDSALTSIQSSSWTLGVLADVLLRKGETGLALIQRIDKLAGYATYTRGNGAVYRRPIVLGSSAATYGPGNDTLLRLTKRQSKVAGAFNRCIVRGALIGGIPVEGEYSAASSVIPTPPEFVTEEISDPLVEDNTKALAIATARVGRYNKLQQEYDLTVVLDPAAQPGTTVTLDVPARSISGDYYVMNVTHRFGAGGATTNLRVISL